MTHDELLVYLQERQPERDWRLSLHVRFDRDDWALRMTQDRQSFSITFNESVNPDDLNAEALLQLVRPAILKGDAE